MSYHKNKTVPLKFCFHQIKKKLGLWMIFFLKKIPVEPDSTKVDCIQLP